MSARNRRDVKPTTTTLVDQALARKDDFMSMLQLCFATSRTPNQVSAALCHLRAHQAVDAVEVAGVLWWMRTPETDTRQRTYETITTERIVKTARNASIKKSTQQR